MYNVICMKWGDLYSARDVNKLFRMVERNLSLPHRFVCFTDDPADLESGIEHFPLPTVSVPQHLRHEAWNKLGTFAYPLSDLEGEALFVDLDVIIVGNMDCFFEYPGEFCIIHNWTHPDRIVGNSSVYRFRVGAHTDVLQRYHQDPQAAKREYRNEQTFLSHCLGADRLTYWPAGWCLSFKRHCMPHRLLAPFMRPKPPPPGSRIVAFHGHPKPEEAMRGVWPGRFRKMRKAAWIADYWH